MEGIVELGRRIGRGYAEAERVEAGRVPGDVSIQCYLAS